MKQDLRELGHDETIALLLKLGERRFRGEQLFRWVHARQAEDLAEMSDVSRALRERLAELTTIGRLQIELAQVSVDGTRKLRLRTADNRVMESVLIPDADARTVLPDATAPMAAGEDDEDDEGGDDGRRKLTQCVSSQIGCAIDCDFCATAKLGFGRHLSVSEIVSQVYQAERLLQGLAADDPTRRAGGDRVTNLVFMGMGEPLHNYDNVLRAIRILLHPLGRNFSRRRITVSTSGLVPAIERLAGEGLPVNLAVSLNASHDEQRDRIMPINKKYPLAELLGALRRFPLERRQRITFEYVLLRDVNDSLQDARRLPALLRGIPCKLNVIPWNPHPHSPYQRPELQRVLAFQAEAMRLGFAVYIRKTRGVDIDAACGQLAAENDPRAGQARKLGRLPVLSGPAAAS
jgi:23S rRNA (adenine2503-C2)-methyltransferase